MLNLACAILQLGKESATLAPETESTLPFPKVLDEKEEKDVIGLLVMGEREPTVGEDPVVMMKDILGDDHLEDQQTKTASLKAV